MKKLSIMIGIILILFLAWFLLSTDVKSTIRVTINGEEITGPLGELIGGGIGLIVMIIVFFCLGMLLLFVFSGIGLIIVAVSVFVGAVLVAIAFPFFIPILFPLSLLLFFIFIRNKRSKQIIYADKSNEPAHNPNERR